MKRFLTTVFAASLIFMGLGAIVEQAGARFKSDEKALDLIRKARTAIGGNNEAASIQSMIIKGSTTQVIKIDGVARSETGETEIAMQLPDKLMKTVKLGHGDGSAAGQLFDKRVDVVVVNPTKDGGKAVGKGEGKGVGIGAEPGTRVVVRTDDGSVKEFKGAEAEKIIVRDNNGATGTWTTKDGKTVNVDRSGETRTWTSKDGKTVNLDGKHIVMERTGSPEAHHAALRHNEMLRLTLGLLLTTPQGMDVDYTYGGEAELDGVGCNVVVASFGGQSFKLFLDRSSNLPVGMSFTAPKMPKVVQFSKEAHPAADGSKERTAVFHKVDASKAMAEFTVRFSDYRAVNGVQLPFKWTQTVNGQADETFDVTSYEINPPDIGNRFQHQEMKVKVRKPDGQ